jgi:hypothetical protein
MARPDGARGITAAVLVTGLLTVLAGCSGGAMRRPPNARTSSVPSVSTSSLPTTSSTPSTSIPVADAIPVLGKPWAPYQSGYGTVRPSVINNGGDPTGIVYKITWQSWGGSQAVGTGKGNYEPPGQPVSASRPEAATVIAFDLGTCQRTFMYEQVEWYFPGEGQHFDPRNAENICASVTQASPGVSVSQAANVPPGIVATFSKYFAAIDSGDYRTAYSELSPKEQVTMTEARFAADESTTDDQNVGITHASPTGANSEVVNVIFTSQQSADKGPGGSTCDTWNLNYSLVYTEGSWLIDSTSPASGSGHTPC